jgi:hypothetical protein
MYDYLKKEEFSHHIKRALLQVENNYEKRLFEKQCTGVIFALKNMNWSDKSVIEHEGNKEKPINIINLGKGVKPKEDGRS